MDASEFRKRGKEMIDYVADYLETVRDRRTSSAVKPGGYTVKKEMFNISLKLK